LKSCLSAICYGRDHYYSDPKRNGSTEFEIPFNRTDMANYLDADRSALTRELARMKDCGLILRFFNQLCIVAGHY